MKRILSLLGCSLLLLCVLLSAVSCKMTPEKASDTLEDFFEAIEEYDYKAAEKLLHDSHKHNLATDFAALETKYDMQLNFAFDLDDRSLKKSYFYDEETHDTYIEVYDFAFDAGAHGDRMEISATVLKDDVDYGVSNLTIRIYLADEEAT